MCSVDMFSKWVTNVLFFMTLILLPHSDAEFIRAVKGATVLLPCHSLPDDHEIVSVKWINRATSKTICEWKFNKTSESSSGQCPRFKINRTSLIIENVQFSDSGDYTCKITRLISPPSVDNSSDVKLQVEGLSLQKQNSSNDSCILLLCSLEGLNPELVNFTWIREGRGSLYSSTTYDMNSSLLLCKPDWSDGDTITCRATYSNPQTPLSMNIKLDFSNKESSQNSPAFCSVLFSTFVICIVFIWMLFCISKYKSVTCCIGPSTQETY